jgi:hypothetical protein
MRSAINAVIILLIISNHVTALSNFIIPINIVNKEYVINLLLFCLLIILNIGFGLKADRKFVNKLFLLCFPLLFIYLFENIRFFINGAEYNVFKTHILFINLLITFISLAIVFKKNEDFIRVLKYYFYFNVFIAISASIVFLLLQFSIISLETWTLPGFIGTSFERKIDFYSGNFNYYFPLYITVIASYSRDFGVLGSFGAFTGFSYEPHLATFFMGPAFFMSFYFLKEHKRIIRLIIIFSFALFFLIATSLTNLIALSVVFIVHFSLKLVKSVSSFVRVLIGFNVFFWSIIIFFNEYIQLLWQYTNYKINSRSNEESVGFIAYILSPKDILGDGVFNFPIVTQQRNVDDIGIIGTFFFIIIFLILISAIVYFLIFKKNYYWLGYAILYFTIHSLKFPFHIIQYPFMLFIFSIIAYASTNKSIANHD